MTTESPRKPTNRIEQRDDADDVDVDLAELENAETPPHAGEFGALVVARCTNCKAIRVKRAPPARGRNKRTFRHACHSRACRRVTHWNILEESHRGP